MFAFPFLFRDGEGEGKHAAADKTLKFRANFVDVSVLIA